MARFGASKEGKLHIGTVLSLAATLGLVGAFVYGTNTLNDSRSEQQLELLQSSVNRSITQCYALEGAYPSNLSYLKDHYGLTYDSEKYYIDYQFIGGNLRPDVTIIERTN